MFLSLAARVGVQWACGALAIAALQDGAPAPRAPVAAASAASSARDAHGRLSWFAGSFAELGARAKAEKRAVMVYLWAEGSRWCARLENEGLSDQGLAASLADVLVWNADGVKGAGRLPAERFGVVRYPVLLFFDKEGRAIDRLDGYLPPKRCAEELARVLRDEGTLTDLERRVAGRPDELELRTRFAVKLQALGDVQGHERELAEIRKRDPKRTSLLMRRELYRARLLSIQEHFDRTREINPGPLVRFLEEERHAELLFEGYRTLCSMHLERAEGLLRAQQEQAARAKRADLRAALSRAALHLPADPQLRVEFALETIATLAGFPSELSEEDRQLLLDLASDAVALLPEEARVHACCALAAFFHGDKADAASALRRAYELEPDNPEWTALAQSMGL